jgi:hypothetical protein
VIQVAEKIGRTPAQVALNWVRQQPGVIVPLVGAKTRAQLDDNLGCLEFELAAEDVARLDAVSKIELGFPHDFLQQFATVEHREPPRLKSAMVQVPRWHAAILAAVALGLYANTFGHGYALDDGIVILDNEYTKAGLSGLPRLLTEDSFQGFLGKETNPVAGGRYRPLSLVTFAIEIAAFGPQHPFVGHLLNALLYALCCVVLYQVMRSLLAQRTPDAGAWMTLPFAAALLFAVHPLHTEAVANIKSRDEILALLFALRAWRCACARPTGARTGPRDRGRRVSSSSR